ncbi:hypothetical protein ATANTOWER_018116 [Ataeniobius toweri]|uniref:Uncharacterized protein n=1 Tax=Ataeniobius toweri TaxID=208326 RepID=A0ABU7AI39_9TELE|nr:hypothetical protein [Ataeniobius toweri]
MVHMQADIQKERASSSLRPAPHHLAVGGGIPHRGGGTTACECVCTARGASDRPEPGPGPAPGPGSRLHFAVFMSLRAQTDNGSAPPRVRASSGREGHWQVRVVLTGHGRS